MGGDNDVITNHIQSNLGGENATLENVVDPVDTDQQQIPQLHPRWLTENEQEERNQQHINAEVHRWLNLERRNIHSTQSQDQKYHATNVQDAPVIPNGGDELEEEEEENTTTPRLRR